MYTLYAEFLAIVKNKIVQFINIPITYDMRI